jgi:hypothetical protein
LGQEGQQRMQVLRGLMDGLGELMARLEARKAANG